MNDSIDKIEFTYFDRMRGFVRTEDLLSAALLLESIKKSEATCKSAYDIFSLAKEVSTKKGYVNPFYDEDQLYRLLKSVPDTLDWEKAILFEERTYKKATVPQCLVNKYAERITDEVNSVMIAEAEKFVPFLQNTIDSHTGVKFTLTTQNSKYAAALSQLFEYYDNVDVQVTNIYEPGFVNRRFDMIFSFPAFGGRMLSEQKAFFSRDFESIALENLSYYLSSGGELIIVLPAKITFMTGKVASLRLFIQENYTIRELSTLPQGIFDNTGIKTCFLNIENTRPSDNDITIRSYSAGKRKSRLEPVKELHIDEDTFIMPDELTQLGDWNIDRVFAQQDAEWQKYQNSGLMKEQLKSIAQVFRGKAVTQKSPFGSVGVINISSIGEYEIEYDKVDYVDEEDRKIANYVLQEGDVLIPARGTAIRTAIFHSQSFPYIANSNVIVIRPDVKSLNSTYLKIFLDSPLGNKLISSAQQGMTVMNISYRDLMNLEIPVPPIAEQQKVADEYNAELKRYMESIDEAEKRWRSVLGRMQEF